MATSYINRISPDEIESSSSLPTQALTRIKFYINLSFAVIVVMSLFYIFFASLDTGESRNNLYTTSKPSNDNDAASQQQKELRTLSRLFSERNKHFTKHEKPGCALVYDKLMTMLSTGETLPPETLSMFKDLGKTATKVADQLCVEEEFNRQQSSVYLMKLILALFQRIDTSFKSQSQPEGIKLEWKMIENDFEGLGVYMSLFKTELINSPLFPDAQITPYIEEDISKPQDPESLFMAVYRARSLLDDFKVGLQAFTVVLQDLSASTLTVQHRSTKVKNQLWVFVHLSLASICRGLLQLSEDSVNYKLLVVALAQKFSATFGTSELSEEVKQIEIKLNELAGLADSRLQTPEIAWALKIRDHADTISSFLDEYKVCLENWEDSNKFNKCRNRLSGLLESDLKRLASNITTIIDGSKLVDKNSIATFQRVIASIASKVRNEFNDTKFRTIISVVADDAHRLSQLGALWIYFQPNKYVETQLSSSQKGPWAVSGPVREPTDGSPTQLQGLFDFYVLLAKNYQLQRSVKSSDTDIQKIPDQLTLTLQELEKVPALFPDVSGITDAIIQQIKKTVDQCNEPNSDPTRCKPKLVTTNHLIRRLTDWLQLHVRGYPIQVKWIAG